MLPDVDKLKEVAVQPRLLTGILEQRLVSPGTTGGDNYAIETVLVDALLEGGQPFLGAAVQVALDVGYVRQRTGVFNHSGYIHDATDVGTAMANEHTNSSFTQSSNFLSPLSSDSATLAAAPEACATESGMSWGLWQ